MIAFSAKEARHLSLSSLGIGANTGLSSIQDTLGKLHIFQLDSVNSFERAHLLPAFSRIGAYDKEQYQRLAFGGKEDLPELTEYWGHCATLLSREDWTLFAFRRADYASSPKLLSCLAGNKKMVDWIRAELLSNGPLTISQFEHDENKRTGNWWGWSEIKIILERMYFAGLLVSAGRSNFSRRYALPEQVGLYETKQLSELEQKRALLIKAADALGVATHEDLADYFRMTKSEAALALSSLLDSVDLERVSVEGWEKPAFVSSASHALIGRPFDSGEREARIFSPFDPLIWKRDRLKRIFDFDYRIEIYTPEAKRKYGYYTLPILHRDVMVGRVDLKHDRKNNVLDVLSLWHQEKLSDSQVKKLTPAVEAELNLARTWVGAEKLNPPTKGNWAFGGGSR